MSNPKRPEVFNHLVLGDSPVRIGADAEVEASLLPSRPAGRQHCGPDGSDKAAPVNHCAPSRSHAKKLRTHGHADHLPHCTKSSVPLEARSHIRSRTVSFATLHLSFVG